MKKFKESIRSIPESLYDEMKELLIKYGITNTEISKITFKSVDSKICGPGKELYCYKDLITGKVYCRCISKS